MAVCTFDNPATMRRECWQDGELVASISASLMASKGFDGHPSIFFGLNVGRKFNKGRIVGNAEALPPDTTKASP